MVLIVAIMGNKDKTRIVFDFEFEIEGKRRKSYENLAQIICSSLGVAALIFSESLMNPIGFCLKGLFIFHTSFLEMRVTMLNGEVQLWLSSRIN